MLGVQKSEKGKLMVAEANPLLPTLRALPIVVPKVGMGPKAGRPWMAGSYSTPVVVGMERRL